MMTLDPAGLEAAAKAIAERVADDQEYERLEQTFQRDADAAVRAYLAAAVPAPTTENPPGEAIGEIARQLVGIGVPVGLAKMAVVAGYDAGFAAGRSALSPLVKDYSDALTDADDHVSVLLSHAAAALERADVGDAEEATAILRAVVNLDGSPVAAGRAAATPDQPKTGATSREQREAAIKKATAMVDADTTGLLRPAVAPAASPDERLREALREIVRQVEEYPALSPTGIMVRDDIAGMVEGTARTALAADRDSLAEKPETDT